MFREDRVLAALVGERVHDTGGRREERSCAASYLVFPVGAEERQSSPPRT